MRVLHLYSGNMYGGVERVLGTLARCRKIAPGMEPEFGLCFHGRVWDELAAARVPVHDLRPVRLSRPWTVVRARGRLRDLLASDRFDAVVVHSCWLHVVFAPAVQRAGGRMALWVHDAMVGRHPIERWAARNPPDVLIANSQFTAGTVPRVFPGVRPAVLYYPVERPEIPDPGAVRAAVRRELGTSAGATVILLASRLERWKGHGVLLGALDRLRGNQDWECWIAGGPQKAGEAEYLAELQAATARIGVAERVRFLGQRVDVLKLMVGADIYCQPNTSPEPFGIAFVEALAAGLPVVTTDFGGGAEVVVPACGALTPVGDVRATADALAELIDNAAQREALGAAGTARAAELCDPGRQLTVAAALLAGEA